MASIVFDEHQRRLIEWKNGKALVLAVAGSGKTTTLIERLAELPAKERARTITLLYNKDAQLDFEKRLNARLGNHGSRVMTFHAFALWVLNQVLGSDQSWKKMRLLDGGTEIRHAINALKVCGIDAPDAKPWLTLSASIRERMIDLSDKKTATTQIAKLYGQDQQLAHKAVAFIEAYQNIKMNDDKYDFADMLVGAVMLLESSQPLVDWLAACFDHVQIDECQDVSVARWRLAQFAAAKAKSCVAVGDWRQSVNAFSGADYTLLKAPYQSGEFQLLTMPVNRRSTRAIIDLGNKICAGKSWHLGGDAKPRTDAEVGSAPVVMQSHDGFEEAVAVVEEIQAILSTLPKRAPRDTKARIAILARTNAALVECETRLRKFKIPCRVRGNPGGVWASREGMAFLTYLRAAEGEAPDNLADIANKPLRYIKRTDIQEVVSYVYRTGDSLVDALRNKAGYGFKAKGIRQFADDLSELAHLQWERRCQKIATLLMRDVREREDNGEVQAAPDEDRGTVYLGLASAAIELGDLPNILAAMEAASKSEKDADVELSTAHKYKGDQAEIVFGVQIAKDVLPHKKSTDLEEELRILYVLVTRAKSKLYLSTGGEPSRFLIELKLAEKRSSECAEDEEEENERDLRRPSRGLQRHQDVGVARAQGVLIRKKGHSLAEIPAHATKLEAPKHLPPSFDPAFDCAACKGEGELQMLGKMTTCPVCKGSGEKALKTKTA